MTLLKDTATRGRKTGAGGQAEDDAELLRRYAAERSEAAFAELVRRHLSPVYAFALRRVGGDAHLAEDVAQVVFTTLARKAASLTERQVLGGWLCRAAHFAARDIVRAERRRRVREQEAQIMHESSSDDAAARIAWEKLQPMLTQTMGELNDEDRDAVWLRFFEGRSFAEVGARLRLTENSARMRVERALDKLHAGLARRGVSSTAVALGIGLASQAGVAAPAGLAAAVARTALSGGAAGGGLLAGVGIFMKKNIVMVGGVAAVAVGVMLVRSVAGGAAEGDSAGTAGSGVVAKASAPAPVMAAKASAPVAAGSADARAASAQAAVEVAPPGSQRRGEVVTPGTGGPVDPAVQQRRAVMNNLRSIAAARDYFLKLQGKLPESLDDLVGPGRMIRELKPANGEDYGTVRLGDALLSVVMADGTPVVLTTGGPEAKGPPTLAETAAWEGALDLHLKTRTDSPEPRLPGPVGQGGPALVGIFGAADGPMFLLNDGKGGAPQRLKLGESLGSLVVAEYREEDQSVVLRDGETTLRLKLREGKVVAPFALETELAYQAIREVQKREGWPLAAMRVQKPQLLIRGGGDWSVVISRVLEKGEKHIVLGDSIMVSVNPQGRVVFYSNTGTRK